MRNKKVRSSFRDPSQLISGGLAGLRAFENRDLDHAVLGPGQHHRVCQFLVQPWIELLRPGDGRLIRVADLTRHLGHSRRHIAAHIARGCEPGREPSSRVQAHGVNTT